MTTENLDPERGDFDAELAAVDARDIQISEGSADARISLQVTVHGDDAARLDRIARVRGQRHDEVIAELLREAERHAG